MRIWNPDRNNFRYSTELRGHTGAIEKVLFNPVRDAELASCSADGTVRFWDVRSKTCVSRLDVGGEAFTMSWSADGSTIVVGKKASGTLKTPDMHPPMAQVANAQHLKDDTLIPISVKYPSSWDIPSQTPDMGNADLGGLNMEPFNESQWAQIMGENGADSGWDNWRSSSDVFGHKQTSWK